MSNPIKYSFDLEGSVPVLFGVIKFSYALGDAILSFFVVKGEEDFTPQPMTEEEIRNLLKTILKAHLRANYNRDTDEHSIEGLDYAVEELYKLFMTKWTGVDPSWRREG